MKNTFHFNLKRFFRPQEILIFVVVFGNVEKTAWSE